jgi:hypothetical protein
MPEYAIESSAFQGNQHAFYTPTTSRFLDAYPFPTLSHMRCRAMHIPTDDKAFSRNGIIIVCAKKEKLGKA